MIEVLRYGPHAEQYGELRLPDGAASPRAVVVLIHGGFWRDRYRLDLMHPLAEDLERRGHATWNIEYRRVGPTGGGYPATLDDVAAAIDHVAAGGLDRLAVVGHSAGGHLALWNAGRADAPRRPDLTIGLAAVSDVVDANRRNIGADATTDFFGGDLDDVPERYAAGQPDPARFAGRVVLIHGDADDSVPVDQSSALADGVARCEILPGCDHFDVIDPRHPSWAVAVDELAAYSSYSSYS